MYGDKKIETLVQHYGRELPAESINGYTFVRSALVSSDLPTSGKLFEDA